jgi:hypothetical protein
MKLSKVIAVVLGISAVGCAIGFLSFSMWQYQQAYQLANTRATNLEVALSQNSVLYGIIRSLDSEKNTLTIETPDLYTTGQSPVVYTLPILSTAFIGHQTLLTDEGGTYVSLSSTTPSSLSALRSGMKVKFLVASREAKSVIYYLLYGDPL